MARRHAWLRWSAGWSTCLFVAGCLFHTEAKPECPFAPKVPPGGTSADLVEPPRVPADVMPEILSDYRPLPPVARLTSASDPPMLLTRVEESKPLVEKLPLPKIAEEPADKAGPGGKESPLVAALRCALEKHSDEAHALLEKYEKSDRELLLALLRLTAGVSDLAALAPEEVEQTLEQLGALTQHLRRRAPLTLGKVCFCRKIENFGQYAALPPEYEFQAGFDGRPGERVQVYAEMGNFASHCRKGQHETRLVSSLVIHDERQQEVVKLNLGPYTDHSQTPRQDLFLNFQFHVPPRLPPGLYTLWVIVKDVTPGCGERPGSERVARRSLDFRVCPPGTRPMP
jgi:hypothetical protein